MSGHSKWHNIQATKGKTDAKRSAIFTKIGRELAIAVKQGGPDPNSNSKLRDVIDKAKAANMPNDNITRSIKKASGELNTVNYEEMLYEGYGAGGCAFIVEALTDNKNRTAGNVRHLFEKSGGSMGTTGCVSYMFTRKGVIVVEGQDMSEDDMMMIALDAGADDVITDEDVYVIYTTPSTYLTVKDNLEKAGVKMIQSGVEYIPNDTNDYDAETQEKILRLIDRLEEDDDVQNVYHNANLPEEEDED